MAQYLFRRLLITLLVVFLVTLFIFVVIRIVPGDVVSLMAESTLLTPDQLQKLKASTGLDKPLPYQYVIWVGGVLRGDLGTSLWTRKPILGEILAAFPVSLELAFLSVAVSATIAIVVGVICAVRQDTSLDYVLRLISTLGLSMPSFWTGTLVIVFAALWFRWSPPVGYVGFFENPGKNLQQFAIPALVQGYYLGAVVMRMTRSSMLEALRQDYVRTAWAKGLAERQVVIRHVIKNAVIPVITMLGGQLVALMGAQVLIEQIFSLPGLSRLILGAILYRDYPLLQGSVLTIAVIVVVVNTTVDITYGWLDPRVRLGK